MRIDRERAIEILLVGLVGGMLYSAFLRDAFAAALLAFLLYDRIANREESRDRTADAALVAFVGVTLVSAFLSRWPRETLLDLRFYPYGVLVFLGARRVAASGRAATIALATLLLVGVLALDVLAQVATGASLLTGRTPVWHRYTGSFPFPADVALLPILFPLASACLTGDGASRAIRFATIAAMTVAVAASGTRAAVLALLFVLSAEALGRHRRAAGTTLAILVVAFAIAAVLAPAPVERLFGLGGGTQHRLAQWRASLSVAREAPFLGHGPHAFRRLSVERLAARDPAFANIDIRYAPYPHSIYLETLVGSGALGLAALLALLALPFRRVENADDAVLDSARIAVAAFAWVALFDMSLKKDWVELAMWLPVGVAIGAAERQRLASRASVASESAAR